MGNKSKRNNKNTIAALQGHNAGGATIPVRRTFQSYSGPIPPAAEMERYAAINPDLPTKILDLTAKQSAHRQVIEKVAISDAGKQRKLGTFCATFLGSLAIIGGVICIVTGHSAEGLTSIVGSIATLAGTFIYGTQSTKKERTEKWKEIQPQQTKQ